MKKFFLLNCQIFTVHTTKREEKSERIIFCDVFRLDLLSLRRSLINNIYGWIFHSPLPFPFYSLEQRFPIEREVPIVEKTQIIPDVISSEVHVRRSGGGCMYGWEEIFVFNLSHHRWKENPLLSLFFPSPPGHTHKPDWNSPCRSYWSRRASAPLSTCEH